MTHIDVWIDEPVCRPGPEHRGLRYAKWFFLIARLPAWMHAEFAEFYGDMKLFCDYKGKRYRCTGASRMGDVWLAEDFDREHGYDLRVDVDDCSNWSDK